MKKNNISHWKFLRKCIAFLCVVSLLKTDGTQCKNRKVAPHEVVLFKYKYPPLVLIIYTNGGYLVFLSIPHLTGIKSSFP
ncbi:MAG: hypothetical protein K5895_04690 [Lachnospiraceae bacterium]|nr:hypothetical protein [Lachnospiraceae bacterium]